MNRIQSTLQKKSKNILSIYFPAYYPDGHILETLTALEKNGVDMVELGIPFSDALADGPVIQLAHQKALQNGFTIEKMFDNLSTLRQRINIPVIAMSYLNPILQYGIEAFLLKAKEVGIDGMIIPDFPLSLYASTYQAIFKDLDISFIPLVTPTTDEQRMQSINSVCDSFVYVLSSSSTTGKNINTEQNTLIDFCKYAKTIIHYPQLIGFGIQSKTDFMNMCKLGSGGIVGTAFIKSLANYPKQSIDEIVKKFVSQLT